MMDDLYLLTYWPPTDLLLTSFPGLHGMTNLNVVPPSSMTLANGSIITGQGLLTRSNRWGWCMLILNWNWSLPISPWNCPWKGHLPCLGKVRVTARCVNTAAFDESYKNRAELKGIITTQHKFVIVNSQMSNR